MISKNPTVEQLLAERQAWQSERERLLRRQELDNREIKRLSKLIGALRQKIFGAGRGEKLDHAQLLIQLNLAEAQLSSLHTNSNEREDEQIEELVAGSVELESSTEERITRYSLPEDIEEAHRADDTRAGDGQSRRLS